MQQNCNEYQRRINIVTEHMNNNLTEPLDIEKLAKIAGFSPYHFHRIFTAIMGESIICYLRRIRLEKAAVLLNTKKNLSILDIALECGFSGAAVFDRRFKSYFGQSPSEFKAAGFFNNKTHSVKGFTTSLKNCPDICIKDIEGTYVLFVKCYTGYNKMIFKAFETLWKYAGQNGLTTPETWAIGIPYDSPMFTKENKCRFDACITISAPVETTGEIGCKYIEGGRYAVAASSGDETAIINVYNYFYGEWLPNSRYQPANKPMYHLLKPEIRGEEIIGFDFSVHVPIEELSL
jgi:AraC family transcriptional regulator